MSCCGGASSVVITGGDGLNVTGSGSTSDPYVISGNIEVALRATQTPTVDMRISGAGTAGDPYILYANATVSVNDLTDVSDPTPPVLGDVLQFDGSNWVYGPAPTQAPGQVNVNPGLTGDGTVSTPLTIAVSEAVDDSVDGAYTYIDVNGELRAQKTTELAWTAITGKPTSFTPAAHTHTNADLTGMLSGTSAPTAGQGIDGSIYFQYV